MSQEAEAAVLGAMLLDQGCVYDVADILSAEDFYSSSHGNIYAACVSLAEQNAPSDLIAVTQQLREDGTLEQAGGATYLTQLTDAIPDVSNARHYAQIIKDSAIKRRLLLLGKKIENSASSPSTKAGAVLDNAQKELLDISIGSDRGAESLAEVSERCMTEIRDADPDTRMARNRVRMPLESLQGIIGGMGAGQLVVVAARPSVGKSALGVQMAMEVCSDGGVALLSSLEMTAEEVAQRVWAIVGRVNLAKIMRHCCSEGEMWRLTETQNQHVKKARLWIDDRPSQTLIQIRGQARRTQARQGKLDLVVVDYLQLMGGRQKGWSREETVSNNAYGLKALAKDLEVPVVAIAQLNRAMDKENRAPRMSDLRESGAIEQAADIVILIHREFESREASMIVAKQRHGPTGKASAIFEMEFAVFSDLYEGRA